MSVATPERRWRKFSATRSAVRIERTAPVISRTVSPFSSALPEARTIGDVQLRIDPAEDFRGGFDARGDGGFLGEDARAAALGADEIARGEIAAARCPRRARWRWDRGRCGRRGEDVKGGLFGHG